MAEIFNNIDAIDIISGSLMMIIVFFGVITISKNKNP
jgi:hypothetical protein